MSTSSYNNNSGNNSAGNGENKSNENRNSKDEPAAFRVGGNWADQSRSLKARFNHLTDQDLALEAGKENEMLDRVQSRLNKNREEVIGIIRSTEKSGKPATEQKPDGEKK